MATSAHHPHGLPPLPPDPPSGGALLPARVRHVVLALMALLLAGATYLAVVRGPAILLDLSGMAALFCG